MKQLAILTLCLSSLVLVHCNSGSSTYSAVSNGNETVMISDNDNTYTLDASFDEGKTMDIFRHINEAVKPNSLFFPTTIVSTEVHHFRVVALFTSKPAAANSCLPSTRKPTAKQPTIA